MFFNELLTDRVDPRRAFFEAAWDHLKSAELIFFDPDNGLARAKLRGRQGSSKYIYPDEIEGTYHRGHSIPIYQHFPMEKRGPFIDQVCADLAALAPGAALSCFTTPFAVFLLLAHPAHALTLGITASVETFSDRRFIVGRRIAA